MALVGLHIVSMLDSSFLREFRWAEEAAVPVERPAVRASSVLERWRELERINRNRNAIVLESDDEDRSSSWENSSEVRERERVGRIVRWMTEGSRRLERRDREGEREAGEGVGADGQPASEICSKWRWRCEERRSRTVEAAAGGEHVEGFVDGEMAVGMVGLDNEDCEG